MRITRSFLIAAALLAATACSDANQSASTGDDGSPATGVTCEYPADGEEPAKPVDPPSTSDVPNRGTASATLQLSAGDVELTLDQEQAPCTVHSFLSLAEQGYFDDTRCHRLVDEGIFILQCGDTTAKGTGGPGYTFADETRDDLRYEAGVVAMANRGPDTNGSQFFLVFDDSELPPDYTVFGRMSDAGLGVVREVAAGGVSPTDPPAPNVEARITGVTLG